MLKSYYEAFSRGSIRVYKVQDLQGLGLQRLSRALGLSSGLDDAI